MPTESETSTFQAKTLSPTAENLAAQVLALSVRVDAMVEAGIAADSSIRDLGELAHAALIDRIDRTEAASTERVDQAISSIRTEWQAETTRLRVVMDERQTAHAREHQLVQLAIEASQRAMDEWKHGANEWRDESSDRQNSYTTKAELNQIIARLEQLSERSYAEIREMITGKGGVADRLRSVEDFKRDVAAQVAGIRGLMATVSFVIILASFAIARFGR